jgi:hypothetical protein
MVLMNDPTGEARHSLGRRTLLRNGLLVGVGLATAGTAVIATESKARALDLGDTAVFNGVTYALTAETGWAQ